MYTDAVERATPPASGSAAETRVASRTRIVLVVRPGPRLLTDPMTTPRTVKTPRVPVTMSYHGVDVTEEYRWLEDGSSEDTIAWTRAQQQLTGTYYDALPWRGPGETRSERVSSSC